MQAPRTVFQHEHVASNARVLSRPIFMYMWAGMFGVAKDLLSKFACEQSGQVSTFAFQVRRDFELPGLCYIEADLQAVPKTLEADGRSTQDHEDFDPKALFANVHHQRDPAWRVEDKQVTS